MLWQLIDLIGGWREVRSRGGFSYQESRRGKRRIVPIEDWLRKSLKDEGWLETGRFADDQVVSRYGDFHISEHEMWRKRGIRNRRKTAA